MAKDILLYGSIWEYNAMYFMDQVAEATEDDASAELSIKINCEGGSPDYGMSIISKIQEIAGQAKIDVEAQAHSMALFALAYIPVEKVSCMDVTQSVLHRAAYPNYFEKSDAFKDSIYYQMLVKTNADLEKAFRARVKVDVLEALPQFKDKNITLKDVFSLDARVEVLLTANDLKAIGLVSKINKITPTRSAQLDAEFKAFKKCGNVEEYKMAAQAIEPKQEKENIIAMKTLAELKDQFPILYAEAVAVGEKSGVEKEFQRIGAVMVFAHLDPDGAKKIIASREPMTPIQQAEFALKAASPAALTAMAEGATKEVVTDEVKAKKALTEKEAEVKAFADDVSKELGVTGKKIGAEVVMLSASAE